VLLKWLRFCYGEEQAFRWDECVAALVALGQLQLTCRENVQKTIVDHMIDVASKDVDAGTMMLRSCALEFPESFDGSDRVSTALAKVVLTLENITMKYDMVVSKCLMCLPIKYLDYAEYGRDHSEFSEFDIRMKYVSSGGCACNRREKIGMIRRIDKSTLNNEELRKMTEVLLDMSEAADQAASDLEKQQDELRKKAALCLCQKC